MLVKDLAAAGSDTALADQEETPEPSYGSARGQYRADALLKMHDDLALLTRSCRQGSRGRVAVASLIGGIFVRRGVLHFFTRGCRGKELIVDRDEPDGVAESGRMRRTPRALPAS